MFLTQTGPLCHGETHASARIPGVGNVVCTKTRRSSSGTWRSRCILGPKCTFCPPRMRTTSPTDAGHGTSRPHSRTGVVTSLRTSRSRVGLGGMSTWLRRSMLPYPLLPYLHTVTAPGTPASKDLVGNSHRSDGMSPVLRPRLASEACSGPRFGLSLEKGAAWQHASAP